VDDEVEELVDEVVEGEERLRSEVGGSSVVALAERDRCRCRVQVVGFCRPRSRSAWELRRPAMAALGEGAEVVVVVGDESREGLRERAAPE